MRPSWRLLTALAILAGAAPAAAPPAADDEEAAGFRRQLERVERIRATDPELYARLRRDWRALHALPPERQERIRKFDQELHQEDSYTQARLMGVLDRYTAWVERLPEAERRRVESAGGSEERLQVVRELREREWVARLPRAVRDKVQDAPAERRPALIAQLREQERQRRQEWQRARGQLMGRLGDFPPEVQAFVNESLHPLLSPEERLRLRKAEGLYPQYGQTILELSERYRILFVPAKVVGPTRYGELPKELKKALRAEVLEKALDKAGKRQTEGRWPDYALAVIEVARVKTQNAPALGPARADQFSPAFQQFVEKELMPKLDDADRQRLKNAEGRWPGYPWAVLELARKHGLTVPGIALPGPRELWDGLRGALPEVPDRVLREFALTELSPEDHARLGLSFSDPTSRERLKEKFFERKPQELQRLRTFDTQVQQRKLKGEL